MLERWVYADSHLVAVALKVIVECELRVCRDGLGGEQTNGNLTALYYPLLCLTVGLTRMVDESAQSPLHTHDSMPPLGKAGGGKGEVEVCGGSAGSDGH